MSNSSCSIIIDNNRTDIVLKTYSDRTLIIISQYGKFGSLITLNKQVLVKDFQNETYEIKTIFGKDDVESHVAARYIAEKSNINSPLLLSICLKNYEVETLKLIVRAINQMRN